MPLVSVIIPVYNVEKYLPACLNSVINQTHKNLEIICVNDGSPDNSPQILKEYAKKDKRFVIIDQKNKGLSGARNEGMKHVTGEFCCFLDSDDAYYPDFIKRLLQIQKETDADIVECRAAKSRSPEKLDANPKMDSRYKVLKNALKTVGTHRRYRVRYMVWSRIYRTELVKNTKFIEGICYEDYPWTICLMGKNPKVAVTNQQLYNYTYNPQSITKSGFTVKKCNDYGVGLRYIYEDFKNEPQKLKIFRCQILPKILKTQINLIRKSNNDPQLQEAFSEQLHWFKKRNMISIFHNNWKRLFWYYSIMKKFKK